MSSPGDLFFYSIPFSGEVAGSATAVQLPTNLQRHCKRVTIEARSTNTGSVYIGFTSGVTVADNTSDITTGVELVASQSVTFHIPHTEFIWYIGSDANQRFIILIET